jgi:hypothetical protein
MGLLNKHIRHGFLTGSLKQIVTDLRTFRFKFEILYFNGFFKNFYSTLLLLRISSSSTTKMGSLSDLNSSLTLAQYGHVVLLNTTTLFVSSSLFTYSSMVSEGFGRDDADSAVLDGLCLPSRDFNFIIDK